MQEAAAKAAFINDREFFGVLRECFGFLIAVFQRAFRAEIEQRGRSKPAQCIFLMMVKWLFNKGEIARSKNPAERSGYCNKKPKHSQSCKKAASARPHAQTLRK
jgi:hypothetical protein